MPALTQRQFYGIFVLLAAFGAIAMVDRTFAAYGAVLCFLGAVVVIWAGGGKGAVSLDGLRQELLRLPARQQRRAAESPPCLYDSSPDGSRALARRRGELVCPRAWERDHEVEAVEQCTRELVAVALDPDR